MPISASLASPGPLTTQPITATLTPSKPSMPETMVSTWFARWIRSIRVRPQVGHETTSTPPFLSPRVLRIWRADLISSIGSPVRETRMVSPMPWYKMIPSPTADLIFPENKVPASVIPTWRGWSVLEVISSCAFTHINTSEDLILMTRLS